jgi:endonuclease/exonuclease/phosphatase family protein
MSMHARRSRLRMRSLTRTSVVAAIAVLLVVAASSVSLAVLGRPDLLGGGSSVTSDPGPRPTATPSSPAPTSSSPSVASPSSTAPSSPPAGQAIVVGQRLKRLPRTAPPATGDDADQKLRDATEDLLQQEPVVVPTSFRVSSFNLLGAAHTERGGRHASFAPGSTRMHWAMSLLQGAGVSVAGVQEMEPPQFSTFRQIAPGWDIYPGMRSRRALANSIMWRSDTWQLVEGHTIDVPYFYGHPKPMPYALLRNVATDQEVWFANFHNPASVHGPAARFRRAAVAREVALTHSLAASGTPVIMTGDMNDRAGFFCPMTSRTQLHAANGGSTDGACRPPATMGIDWILGTPDVAFSDHHMIRGGLVARTSDHPFVWSAASIAGPASP